MNAQELSEVDDDGANVFVSLELRHCTSCEDKGKFSTILFEVIQFFIVLKWLS